MRTTDLAQSRTSLLMAFLVTPVIRSVERIEFPSTKHRITWARLFVLILFIKIAIMLE
jgi:hypothetical protein